MKRLVGIFAHPDDEALGPSGTLATFAKDHEIFLICATGGEANGKTPEERAELRETRQRELEQAASVIGVKQVFFLGYPDGELRNNIYHRVAEEIKKILDDLKPESLMTFELRGISGHIDHITISMVTSFLFNKAAYAKKLMYYCISKEESELMKDYFIYFPEGFRREEVDEVIDISESWDTKVAAMHCHKSQIKDVENVLKNTAHLPREEYFFIKQK